MTAARRPRSATAARMPFVLLIVTLLAGGLISLLLLNAAVNSDSFKLDKLDKETTGYTDEQQALQQEVDQYGAPGSLEQRARELGMVPGGNPAFLGPDGKVHGSPEAATAPPPPPTTPPPTTPPAKPADAPAANTTAGKPPAGNATNTNTAAHAPAAGTGQPATAPAATPATQPATTPAR